MIISIPLLKHKFVHFFNWILSLSLSLSRDEFSQIISKISIFIGREYIRFFFNYRFIALHAQKSLETSNRGIPKRFLFIIVLDFSQGKYHVSERAGISMTFIVVRRVCINH